MRIAPLIEGYFTYSYGRYEPDFISVNYADFEKVHDALVEVHKRGGWTVPPCKNVGGRVGILFMNAILHRDDSVPTGKVRFENSVQPDNPHLNGERELVYD